MGGISVCLQILAVSCLRWPGTVRRWDPPSAHSVGSTATQASPRYEEWIATAGNEGLDDNAHEAHDACSRQRAGFTIRGNNKENRTRSRDTIFQASGAVGPMAAPAAQPLRMFPLRRPRWHRRWRHAAARWGGLSYPPVTFFGAHSHCRVAVVVRHMGARAQGSPGITEATCFWVGRWLQDSCTAGYVPAPPATRPC